MLTEAMVRQAEVDAAYLVVEAARADPIFQAELQRKRPRRASARTGCARRFANPCPAKPARFQLTSARPKHCAELASRLSPAIALNPERRQGAITMVGACKFGHHQS